ncbi:MAG: mechanosensitive ion channel family protein [Thermoplasmatota archaeon]
MLAELWNDLLALPEWVLTLLKVAAVFLIGYVVDWILDRILDRALKRNKFVDDTARTFLVRTMDIGVWAITFVVALSYLGVDPAALAGGIAVSGFIVGFALKDTLGNLAAGLMLLVYRPFHVGDTVTISGDSGDVVSLGMALTVLKTGDGKLVTMPNGKVLGGTIINHTREPARRADVLVGIHYDDDVDQAVQAILAAVSADDRVLPHPAPSVRVTNLGDNAVGLQVRPWVATGNYWQAQADLHKTVKEALTAAGCRIPYPQTDVHLHTAAPA